MNEHYQRGFIKAAMSQGLSYGEAIDLLKISTDDGPIRPSPGKAALLRGATTLLGAVGPAIPMARASYVDHKNDKYTHFSKELRGAKTFKERNKVYNDNSYLQRDSREGLKGLAVGMGLGGLAGGAAGAISDGSSHSALLGALAGAIPGAIAGNAYGGYKGAKRYNSEVLDKLK